MKESLGPAVLACFLGIFMFHVDGAAQCTQIVDLHGTVLDSETNLPVQGVLVCVDEYCNPPCYIGPYVCILCTQTNASGEFHIHRECMVGEGNAYTIWFFLHLSKDSYISKDINGGKSWPQQTCYAGRADYSVPVDFGHISLSRNPSGILGDDDGGIPATFALHQNYPNPFNLATTIAFTLPGPVQTDLVVYDLLGRVVHSADLGFCAPGTHTIQFAALDAVGRPLRSGVYFYWVIAGSYSEVRRMVVLK
jgi:hypothetical protein